MGKKDVVEREFFSDPRRFADLLNGFLYHGQQVVRPEDVREQGEVVARVRSDAGQSGSRTENIAEKAGDSRECVSADMMTVDLVREVLYGMRVCVVFLENQADVHYVMPVRVMNEEAAYYHKQWRQTAGKHKKEKDLRGAEYLSGFSKKDRLKPVITIVIYWGKTPWNGPRRLKEILDLDAYPLEMQPFIADYPIHLLEVRKFEKLENFTTDIRYVFGFLQREQNKEALAEYVETNRESFRDMSEEAYNLLIVQSNTKELKRKKNEFETEKGGYDMCKAIRDMVEDGRMEGKLEGKIEGKLEGKIEGKLEGKIEGRNTTLLLITRMTEDNRLEDVPRLAKDKDFLDEMLKKYMTDEKL